jgi:ADP-ribose pyrophosphatase YjhB (NUDIX family)
MKQAVRCVGAVILDEAGRLLMIERGRPPGVGLWSIPGGRVEPGESDAAALVREVREETGLDVVAGHLIGSIQHPGPGESFYDVHDYAATLTTSAEPTAGDDAAAARWVPFEELRSLPTAPGLLAALRAWHVIPG